MPKPEEVLTTMSVRVSKQLLDRFHIIVAMRHKGKWYGATSRELAIALELYIKQFGGEQIQK